MFTKYSVNTKQSKQMASWLSILPQPKLYLSNCSLDRVIFVIKHTYKIILDISLMHVCTPNTTVVTSENKRDGRVGKGELWL